MKKIFILAALLSTVMLFAQKTDQYSLEIDYGFNSADGISGFTHAGGAFRYMVSDYWGLKFDYGYDQFREGSNPEIGTNYHRFSAQGVYNLGRKLKFGDFSDGYFNTLLHGGLGYSALQAVQKDGIDNIGNVIIGITPQVWLSESFALTVDASYIFNFTQHYGFDGYYPNGKPAGNSFTGNIITASVGVTYYFGKNKNRVDFP